LIYVNMEKETRCAKSSCCSICGMSKMVMFWVLLLGWIVFGGYYLLNSWAMTNWSPWDEVTTIEFQNLWKAPAFEVTTTDGEVISLDSLLASWKPSMIYFTASRCPKCARNRPSINEVYPEFKDSVNIFSVSIDASDTVEVMKNLAQKKNLTYPMTPGYPQVMVDFWVTNQATTVVLDKNGDIILMKNYQVLSVGEYRNILNALLNQ